jgi:myo-inositol-1(or 4)-monophosphatase
MCGSSIRRFSKNEMKKENINQMKNVMIKAAKDAGIIVMKEFKRKHHIKEKMFHELVSEADKDSERIIKKLIKKNFPCHNIISEESEKENNNSEFTWFIDPIDGTHNYLYGLPFFGINIGLMKDNEIILGVMNFPALNVFVFAQKGKGCFVNGKRVHVSKRSLGHSLFVTTTHILDGNALEEMRKARKCCFSHRTIGSAAYDCYLVCAGIADIYLSHSVKPWDIAPGILAIREAGGLATDFKLNPADVWMKDVLFSNGKVHNGILKCLME